MSEPPIIGTVLLVDDDVLIRDAARSALEEVGFSVVAALDDTGAVAALESAGESFCALVTDVNLGCPRSGWDIARAARALSPRLPVVYVSGAHAQEWRLEGVPDSLMFRKPLTPERLVGSVIGLLEARESLRATA